MGFNYLQAATAAGQNGVFGARVQEVLATAQQPLPANVGARVVNPSTPPPIAPMTPEFYKNPKVLLGAGALVIVLLVVLFRRK